jgi:predicted metal-dependent hydrolase
MRSIKIFSLALFLISICFSQERGIGLRESEKANFQSFYKNSWAVVIGINDYIRAPKLKYAVRDAEEFTEVLVNYYGFKRENIVKLIDREATKENIMKAFDKLRSKAGKEDRVLVFFAGHGITVPLPDGREKGYILPVDGSQDELITSAISTDQLNEISQLIKAKHLFFIMDACYGGLIFARAQPLSPSALDYLEVISTRRARKALTAGGRDQTVLDTGPGGHSVFTYYLIDGLKNRTADLNGDGIITSGELNEYVAPRVTAESNRSQTPEYGILAGDMGGDFVFIPGEFIVVPKEARNSVDFVVKVEEFPDARIYIDGDFVGSGSIKIEVPVRKTRTVMVEKEGYKKYKADIFVSDKPVELKVKLEPIKGILKLNTKPEGARVSIDGSIVGVSPLTTELSYGEHKIKIDMPGYNTEEMTIKVLSDGEIVKNVSLKMKETPERIAMRIYKRKLLTKHALTFANYVASAGAGVYAFLLNREADDYYEKYTKSKLLSEINYYKDRYNKTINKRNIAIGVSAGFAIVGTYFLLKSVNLEEILKEVKSKEVSMFIVPDEKKLQFYLSLRF